MKVSYFPKKISNRKTSLILGGFESIHNGHLKLIEFAKTFKNPISIMIIENPQDIPGHNNKVYASLNVRLQQLSNLGLSYASVVKLNSNILMMKGQEFLEKIIEATSANKIIVGKDFALGKNRELVANKIHNAFIINHEKINNNKISTSLLKELVEIGNVEFIKKISPFYYTIDAQISTKKIAKIGKSIKPHSGIYVGFIIVNDIKYFANIHVSMNGKIIVDAPDINFINRPYRSLILFKKMIRKIYKSFDDNINDSDKNAIISYINT